MGRNFLNMLVVDVLSVVVAEVVGAVSGMFASSIWTMFGGGSSTVEDAEVSGVEVASGISMGLVVLSVVLAGVLEAGTSGVLGGTMIGNGRETVVVGVTGGGGGVAGVVVGVLVGTEGGVVIGNCTSWIGVVFSVEVDADKSRYAELFVEKLPKGASGGRSCVSASSGLFHPSPSTDFGRM
jgi:hypothetical protein